MQLGNPEAVDTNNTIVYISHVNMYDVRQWRAECGGKPSTSLSRASVLERDFNIKFVFERRICRASTIMELVQANLPLSAL